MVKVMIDQTRIQILAAISSFFYSSFNWAICKPFLSHKWPSPLKINISDSLPWQELIYLFQGLVTALNLREIMRDQFWIQIWLWISQMLFQLMFLSLLIQPILLDITARSFVRKEINYFSFSTWIIVYSIIIHAPLMISLYSWKNPMYIGKHEYW